jgi:hypothetical protein
VIIGEVVRQAQRDGIQARGGGVKSSHDTSAPRTMASKSVSDRIAQSVLGEKRIGVTEPAIMGQFGTGNVAGNRAGLAGNGEHVAGGNQEKLRILVDERCHQPLTGVPLDFGAFASDQGTAGLFEDNLVISETCT